ncbi:1-acyl-sn-glycerol-3-phosphate acyltransferase [Granulicella cerasi]|uniref:1-acyl-sn-glycerol-3-phosphate acyltransferase n=1 Tax=Granulicella cerasi TaxID=741063 RepID=A0ABW1Z5W7_9BACT
MIFRKLFRLVRVVLVFAYYIVEVIIRRPKTRALRAAWLSRLCKSLMRAANITVSVEGPIPTQGAVITNHLNLTDILAHSAVNPCVFISKMEVRKLPVMGWVSMMAGTLYVERGAGGQQRRPPSAWRATSAKAFPSSSSRKAPPARAK